MKRTNLIEFCSIQFAPFSSSKYLARILGIPNTMSVFCSGCSGLQVFGGGGEARGGTFRDQINTLIQFFQYSFLIRFLNQNE
jgi:hypothetical protein